MTSRFLPALILTAPILAQGPQVRVGLDTQQTEWIVSLDGGGQVQDRAGHALMTLREGQKLRIWWDSKGEADVVTEYRVQVGRAQAAGPADALMAKLKALGEAPERLHVQDGDTWRVLTGHFAQAEDAEATLQKLQNSGYDELWVSSEPIPAKPRRGRALYAITEAYERRPLPNGGVRFVAKGETTDVAGKGRYRGRVEIFPNAQGRLTLMDTVDMETYVRGVVPREMGAWEFPSLEALKAQAVAARTYAYANLGKRAKEGFDMTDTVSDQVYGGKEGEQALTDIAVQQTSGLVATYGGKPIQALFMADCGGHTIDSSFVFGGDAPYLRGASCYPARPLTRNYVSGAQVSPEPFQPWLSWELLKLEAAGGISPAWLKGDLLQRPARTEDLAPVVKALQQRLNLEQKPLDPKLHLYLALGRAMGFGGVVAGQERPQDAAYFAAPQIQGPDPLLAGFLSRRGFVPSSAWADPQPPTLGAALKALSRMWLDLEPTDFIEGTLLADGQVRPKRQGPQPLALSPQLLLAEEAPDGSLRLLQRADIQVGDRVRWIAGADGARILVRHLDPDGAAWDRYNPTAHWRVEIGEADLLSKIRQRLPQVRGLNRLDTFTNDEGRVTELDVVDQQGGTHRFSGMRIRGLLGLKDNVFRFLVLGTAGQRRWVFYGRGWGHGVGMCQTGAYGMALEGASYDQILKHYYTGIELTKMP